MTRIPTVPEKDANQDWSQKDFPAGALGSRAERTHMDSQVKVVRKALTDNIECSMSRILDLDSVAFLPFPACTPAFLL